MKHLNRYVWLDLARGLSAIEVCVFHLRYQIFQPYEALSYTPGPLTKLFYASTAFGPQAVYVFFVLSGFFVGGSVLNRGHAFEVTDYFVARLSRLWIVLLPALLATAIIDAVIRSFAQNMVITFDPEVTLGQYSVSVATFAGNVAFLQRIFVPVFGSNAALWSLTNEFWYYATFPLIALSIGAVGRPTSHRPRVIAASAAAAIFLIIIRPYLFSGFLVWLMGVFAYIYCRNVLPRKRPFKLLIALTLFGTSLVYSKRPDWQSIAGLPSDIAVGLGFSLVCILLASWPQPDDSRFGRFFKKLSNGLSEFSYSLYLTHFPLVVLITSLVYQTQQMRPGFYSALQFCLWLALLLAAGAGFWFAFERHTPKVRQRCVLFLRATCPWLFEAKRAE